MTEHNPAIQGHGVVAIIQRNTRYLMILRPEEIRAGGYWCFVGGAVEPGETQRQAVIREVKEEVGLNTQPRKKVWECLSLNQEWILHCWTVDAIDDTIIANPAEVADFAWLTVPQIHALPKVMPSVTDYLNTLLRTTTQS